MGYLYLSSVLFVGHCCITDVGRDAALFCVFPTSYPCVHSLIRTPFPTVLWKRGFPPLCLFGRFLHWHTFVLTLFFLCMSVFSIFPALWASSVSLPSGGTAGALCLDSLEVWRCAF